MHPAQSRKLSNSLKLASSLKRTASLRTLALASAAVALLSAIQWAPAFASPGGGEGSAGMSRRVSQGTHQAKAFRDCAACPEMVVIPAGSFEMGAPPNVHRVTLAHSFAMGRFEVTQAQWQALMGSNPSHFRGAALPVEQVNWDDAQAFIRKLNRKTGRHYRLPSEAEWEYACRAGAASDFCGGDDADSVAWYGALGDPGGNSGHMTHPVGLKRPNAFGLYDMSGNVWEWVADPWHPTYAGAPADGGVWQGQGGKRVIRGGSWLDYPLLAHAAFRVWAGVSKRSSDLGFRVALDLPQYRHRPKPRR